jgi:RHS repeat-associated protein
MAPYPVDISCSGLVRRHLELQPLRGKSWNVDVLLIGSHGSDLQPLAEWLSDHPDLSIRRLLLSSSPDTLTDLSNTTTPAVVVRADGDRLQIAKWIRGTQACPLCLDLRVIALRHPRESSAYSEGKLLRAYCRPWLTEFALEAASSLMSLFKDRDEFGHSGFEINLVTLALHRFKIEPHSGCPLCAKQVEDSAAGATVYYNMVCKSYTVQTNFLCSNITDFPATAENLVSEIDLPDYNATTNPNARYVFTYEPTYQHSSNVTGCLASVTLPTGGTITYSYGTGGTNGIVCADGSTSYLARSTPDTGTSSWVYTHSESGSAWTTNITDPTPQLNQTVLNFQGLYLTEEQAYAGSVAPGHLLKTIINCYNNNTSNCNSTAIVGSITQITHTVQWPGTLGPSKITTTYDTYGNLTEKDEYDYGASTPTRKTLVTYANPGNYINNRRSSVTVEDGSGNIKSQTTVTYDQGTVAASGVTTQHVNISGNRGNPTTISQLVAGTNTLSRTFTYYDTGVLNTMKDVNAAQWGNASYTFQYGGSGYMNEGNCYGAFFMGYTYPNINYMSKSFGYNCLGGVLAYVTDENNTSSGDTYLNNQFYWLPDYFSSGGGGFDTTFTFTHNSAKSESQGNNQNIGVPTVIATLDSLGRPHLIQTQESANTNAYDTAEMDYGVYGNVVRNTLPYVGTLGQTNPSGPATSWAYDPLQRLTQSQNSGGTCSPSTCMVTSYTYAANDTYQSVGPAPPNENAKRMNYEYDGLGRMTSVCEITSLPGSGPCGQTSSYTGYWTRYKYDALNHVIGVCQFTTVPSTTDCVASPSAGQQTRTYTYDGLGRMTSEKNPEVGQNGNQTIYYTYDSDTACGTSSGDLVKKVDPAGDRFCYAYDSLHRLTSVTYSGGYSSNTPNKYFVYDGLTTLNGTQMANARMRLSEAYTATCSTCTKITDLFFSYDFHGNIADEYELTPNSGQYFHVTQSYWANGVPDQLSGLPGLPTITNKVDYEGRVYSVSASTSPNPVTAAGFNAASLPTAVNFGSPDSTKDSDSFQYDPNTNWMTQFSLNVNNQSLVGNLTWNPIGSLNKLVITDPFNSSNSQTCNYSGDDLSRIASVSCSSTPAWAQTFSYDAFGNIAKTGNDSFGAVYTGPPPTNANTNHMLTIGGSAPSYDLNGNVTNDFLHSYAFDANGNPVTIDTVGATYDALGRMVEQNRSGQYTQIVYAPSGGKLALMQGTSTLVKGYVPLPGGTTAVYNSTGLAYYRHSDWVGSSRLASRPNHSVYFDGAYAPFGEVYASIGTNDLSFTGQNQDTVPNLYDFPNREYGIQGRWPSWDQAGFSVVNLGDPQTLNRYSYVRNSPLNLVDPDGYCPTSTIGPMMARGPTIGPGTTQQTPWYQTCTAKALAKGLASAGVDAIGLLPEGGLVKVAEKGIEKAAARQIGNFAGYRGIVADQLGTKIVEGVKNQYSVLHTYSESGDISYTGLASTTLGVADIVADVAGAVPVVGQVISGLQVANDFFKTGIEIARCN